MAGIIPRICAKIADKAKENMKYANLRAAMRIICEEAKVGSKSVEINAYDIVAQGQSFEDADSNLLGYVGVSLRTLGFKTMVVDEFDKRYNYLRVEWDG